MHSLFVVTMHGEFWGSMHFIVLPEGISDAQTDCIKFGMYLGQLVFVMRSLASESISDEMRSKQINAVMILTENSVPDAEMKQNATIACRL